MIGYLLRRVLYSIPILIGVNILTFALFFMVNTPDDMAAIHLGNKHLTQESVQSWKEAKGYDLPLFVNEAAKGTEKVTDTIFFNKSIKLFAFDFGKSDDGRDIGQDVLTRMWPSLAIAVPALMVGLIVNVFFGLLLVFFRGTYVDTQGVIVCVFLMSVSMLFYIIGAQYLFAKVFQWVPISGYVQGTSFLKFLILPILVGVIGGIGAGVRWYRTLFLEEIHKDYVKTAKSKGLSDAVVLLKHVLPNAMLPILTGVVAILPLLFLGSLLTESFFAIPGLGSYTIDAISQQDFAIVRSMVFLGSVLYIVGLILTDISYTLVDPRVRLK